MQEQEQRVLLERVGQTVEMEEMPMGEQVEVAVVVLLDAAGMAGMAEAVVSLTETVEVMDLQGRMAEQPVGLVVEETQFVPTHLLSSQEPIPVREQAVFRELRVHRVLQVRLALFREVFLCREFKALTALPAPMVRMAVVVVVQEVQV
jgi:hypothetical protein